MRRIWRQQADGSLVEVTPESRPVARYDGVLWNDRAYQDAGDPRFASRTEHRAYMKANGLTTADDYSQEWDRARQAREQFYAHAPDPARKSHIVRAVEMLQAGHHPHRLEEL